MFIDALLKIADFLCSCALWVFTFVVNVITIPLSFLYTMVTTNLPDKWKLAHYVCYVWFSPKDNQTYFSATIRGVPCAVDKISNPKSFIASLAVTILPMLIAASVTALYRAIADRVKPVFDSSSSQ